MTNREAYDKGRNDIAAALLWYLSPMSEEDKEEIKKSYDPPKEDGDGPKTAFYGDCYDPTRGKEAKK